MVELTDLERVIKKAGAILLTYWHKSLVETSKGTSYVTEADLAVERFLIAQLGQLLPEVSFLSEEAGAILQGSDYQWVIDPLDGTTNFVRHIPYFCISVALTHHDIPIIAAIYHPITDEYFFASRSEGAFLNGERITVSQPRSFKESVIAFGIPYAKEKREPLIRVSKQILQSVRAVRHLGAVALDAAYVAAGRFDGLIFSNLSWWDIAAGMLMIEKSGGIISDFEGNQLTPKYSHCIAGGQLVYDAMKELLQKSA